MMAFLLRSLMFALLIDHQHTGLRLLLRLCVCVCIVFEQIAMSSNNKEEEDSPTTTTTRKKRPLSPAVPTDNRTSRDYYFDSYAHHAIHEEMLKDHVRTKTYQTAILQNSHLFQNKIVLDVGCGTGILSMFCIQAGAKHVYGIDSSTIIQEAQEIVDINGFSDKITLIQSKVEDIVDLPDGVDQVDIIVSEWMGYFLLYENMLDTVIFARDKWLVKDGGMILPDKATMYICAVEDAHIKRDRMDFWKNVYGFDMTPLRRIAMAEPIVDVVDPKAIVTNAVQVLDLDIMTCTKEDLTFIDSPFELVVQRNDYIHAMCVYFECAFTQIHKPIGFSTAPFCQYTHWKQTLLYLQQHDDDDDGLTVCQGEKLYGSLSCRPNACNKRDLDIGLTLKMTGKYCHIDQHMDYRLR
jgi:protein arginine N-methyltransferase 1